jgi:hypothetical protein
MAYFKMIPRYFHGSTEENHKNPKPEQPVSRRRYEAGISRICGISANYSTFCLNLIYILRVWTGFI